MEPTTLDRAVEAVRALTLKEQQQLRRLMDSWQEPQPVETSPSREQERKFAEYLLAKGIITHIPTGYPEGYVEPPPIVVSGEPVSETIIQERR